MPLVSVIVPVYKVEKYLTRCLDSIRCQSLQDIEILLIDDASPDRCGNICDTYAAKDKRITVIHNETNQGLSVARNIGIAHATSDYLMFVDSDDYVHEDFCKAPYECAIHYKADLVMFRHASPGYIIPLQHNTKHSPASGYKTKSEAMDLLLNGLVGMTAWNKLYSKSLFINILYPPGYLYEDWGTTHKLIWESSCIYYIDRVLYYYQRLRTGSITFQNSKKSFHDSMIMHIQQYYDLAALGYSQEKLTELLANIALIYCIKQRPSAFDVQYKYFSDILCSTNEIPKIFNREHKILFILYKYCQPLFELICTLCNKKKS